MENFKNRTAYLILALLGVAAHAGLMLVVDAVTALALIVGLGICAFAMHGLACIIQEGRRQFRTDPNQSSHYLPE